jgi:hypothetical protein
MRITKEMLFKLAKDAVAQRIHSEVGILAVYLHGSLLDDEPLLGGTTDIDLFFVHTDDVEVEREIVRITDEIHLDIAHYARRVFRQPKELRKHLWLGPTLSGCQILHDPHHFMDFTQASVRGQFDRPDQVLERVRPQAEHARQIWLSFTADLPEPGVETVMRYLRAVEHAADAVALLSGPPLTERRFLLKFPARAQAIGKPGLFAGMMGLLGGPAAAPETLRAWLSDWRAAFDTVPGDVRPARFHPHRLPYYLRAFDALLSSEQPQAVLWPLLHTWTYLAALLPADAPQLALWQEALTHLGLSGPALTERVAALDAYLDLLDETLEVWENESGA